LVHVKKVEIYGFKSFGFKNTVVQFEPGLVSISGPNGSGKSNILDAIQFAMGENKPKTLRVDKLRSLIHDIEGNRRGPKMTRSSVHFDNSDRKIPVDSDLVEITREMNEHGESIYYLNKKKTTRSQVLDRSFMFRKSVFPPTLIWYVFSILVPLSLHNLANVL